MARQLIIGIDPATATGICCGHVGEKPILLTQRFSVSPQDEAEDIYGRATHFWANFLSTRKPDLVAIEAPIEATWGKTNANTTSMTRGLYAIFTGIAKSKGLSLEIVQVKTWRKYFLGRGNLKRAEAKQQCVKLCQTLGWHAPDHNAAEAAGIWMYGCAQIAPQSVQRIEPLFVHGGAA